MIAHIWYDGILLYNIPITDLDTQFEVEVDHYDCYIEYITEGVEK